MVDTSALCFCDVEGLMLLFGHQPRNFYSECFLTYISLSSATIYDYHSRFLSIKFDMNSSYGRGYGCTAYFFGLCSVSLLVLMGWRF